MHTHTQYIHIHTLSTCLSKFTNAYIHTYVNKSNPIHRGLHVDEFEFRSSNCLSSGCVRRHRYRTRLSYGRARASTPNLSRDKQRIKQVFL